MNYRDHLAKMIVVEEYYIHVDTDKFGKMQFRVRYIVHNGYTLIEPLTDYNKRLNDFEDWLRLRMEFNTRYDEPHWYKPIRFNRERKIVEWALGNIQKAYNQYYQETIDGLKQ